jgi:hypothetical protein
MTPHLPAPGDKLLYCPPGAKPSERKVREVNPSKGILIATKPNNPQDALVFDFAQVEWYGFDLRSPPHWRAYPYNCSEPLPAPEAEETAQEPPRAAAAPDYMGMVNASEKHIRQTGHRTIGREARVTCLDCDWTHERAPTVTTATVDKVSIHLALRDLVPPDQRVPVNAAALDRLREEMGSDEVWQTIEQMIADGELVFTKPPGTLGAGMLSRPTVTTATLEGVAVDTFATEAEHAGIHEEQAPMFDRGRPAKKVDDRQMGFEL